MLHRNNLTRGLLCVSFCCTITSICAPETPKKPTDDLRAVLLSAAQVTQERIRSLKVAGTKSIVVELRSADEETLKSEREAAQRILQSGLNLYYWIEVARCPELADAHPQWMASLQGHQEWRRFFPDAPLPEADEVVKAYPWVPILYKEAFQSQLERVQGLLRGRPKATGVFLNDLQGAPSACGCGNPLCRWTTDYGKIRTATPLGADAAALFIAAVQKCVPDSEVIPVWTTECEEHDGAKDGLCAGVGCFKGLCWKAYTAQLMPVAQQSQRLAVLLPSRLFQRDLPFYGGAEGWIRHAVRSFQTMPPRHQGKAISAARLICVLQGWDVPQDDVAAQIRATEQSGAAGNIVSYVKIEQGWQPRVVKWR